MKSPSVWPADDIESIIDQYSDMLYRVCILMLKNESDAEDAVQETIIKYFQKAPSFESSEHQKAWLIRVATNKCRDALRFRLRHPLVGEEYFAGLTNESSDSSILDALADVPEKFRIVLTLHYIEGYSTQEIAKIIRRTPSAVKMRLQKGRRLLEEIYRKEYL